MIFEQEVAAARAALRQGKSIRIVGGRGSGKSTVLSAVASGLERGGETVWWIRGEQAAGEQPGYVMDRLSSELGVPPRPRSLAGTVDELTARTGESAVLVLDDLHRMDALSVKVLVSVRDRLGLRTVLALPLDPVRQLDFPPRWPERTITLEPITIAQTAELAHQVLGGRLESTAAARVYGKSGGVPLLVSAILSSARDRDLLVEQDGMWVQSGPTLWNPDLIPLTSWFLDDVEPEVVGALRSLALQRRTRLDDALEVHGRDTIGRAADLGLLRVSASAQGAVVEPWPPILSDCFQRGTHSLRRSFDEQQDMGPAAVNDRTTSAASLARTFELHEQELSEEAYRQWLDAPSPSTAVAFYREASGDPRLAREVERVLVETVWRRRDAGTEDFLLAFAQAQWLAFQKDDLDAGVALLREFAGMNQAWAKSSRAALMLFDIMAGRGVPRDLDVLESDAEDDPLGLCRSVQVLGLLAGGRISEAARLGDDAGSRAALGRVGTWARLLIPLLEGNPEQAVARCTEVMKDSVLNRARSPFVLASYVAMMGYHYLGENQAMRNVVDQALLVGCPELMFTPLSAAFLNVRGLMAFFEGKPDAQNDSIYESSVLSPRIGPFYGMGVDIVRAVTEHLPDLESYDREAAACARSRREAGYLLGAVQAAFGCLILGFGPRTVDELSRAVEESDIPFFRPLKALAENLVSGDAEQVERSAREDAAEVPANMVFLLISSAARSAEHAGSSERAARLRAIASGMGTRGDRHDEPSVPRTRAEGPAGHQVSPREREVGLLAGRLTNQQIAERLGISVRTVDNHIANALKKTGTASRGELCALLSGKP